MEWFTVIALILFGIALIIVEIIFVPGTTIVGVLGFLIGGFGIYLGFDYFGNATGYFILGTSCVISFALIFYALKTGSWNKFALNDTHTSKVYEDFKEDLIVGTVGKMVSTAKPVGKAMFDDLIVEVSSKGAYIDAGTPIKIIFRDKNKILVEPNS